MLGSRAMVFLLGPNFDLKKYCFDLYNEFFMEKMAQIHQI
jgi:hypothetical protein